MYTASKILFGLSLVFLPLLVLADNAATVPASGVEGNIQVLDKDHDGMVTVFEIRAFIEARHGKQYQQEVLDDMESSASGKSCSSPFAKSRY
jgi:hypothetical protein